MFLYANNLQFKYTTENIKNQKSWISHLGYHWMARHYLTNTSSMHRLISSLYDKPLKSEIQSLFVFVRILRILPKMSRAHPAGIPNLQAVRLFR